MKVICLILLVVFCFDADAQLLKHSFESADSLSVIRPKPHVIFVRTGWCKICDMLEHSVLKNDRIAAVLNENFYFVEFYADEKRTITFNHKKYHFEASGAGTGINQLVYEFASANGQLIYPTLVFMDPSRKIILKHHSFIDSDTLHQLLMEIVNR